MCKKVLKSIFDGDYLTWEEKARPFDDLNERNRRKELGKKIEDERNYFLSKMTEEEKVRFDEYHCLILERDTLDYNYSMYNNFLLGISAGIEIMEHKQVALKKVDSKI